MRRTAALGHESPSLSLSLSFSLASVLSLACRPAAPAPGELAGPIPPEPVVTAGPSAPAQGPTAVGDWGLWILAPTATGTSDEFPAGRTTLHLADGLQVELRKVDQPAPATLADALPAWDLGDDLVRLTEGTTDTGVLFAARSFRVRTGHRDAGGRQVHYWIGVARAYAVLALDARTRVECTGYVEHPVASADDPSLTAVLDVCLSMQVERPAP